ncbi:hypothetical protein V7D15_07015 [Thermoanaerobacter thermohydrosulfuricus]
MILLKNDILVKLVLSEFEVQYLKEALEFYYRVLVNEYQNLQEETEKNNVKNKLYFLEDLINEFDNL